MASKKRSKIFPHLWYSKDAEEAARFYASIFPDSRVDRVTSLMSESPSGTPGSVRLVVLRPTGCQPLHPAGYHPGRTPRTTQETVGEPHAP